jgi:hypothetical protein
MRTVATYSRIASEVTAVRWLADNEAELLDLTGGEFEAFTEPCDDDPDATASFRENTHGTWVLLCPGDWVVRDGLGALRRYTHDEFVAEFRPSGVPAVTPT